MARYLMPKMLDFPLYSTDLNKFLKAIKVIYKGVLTTVQGVCYKGLRVIWITSFSFFISTFTNNVGHIWFPDRK